MTNYTLPTTTRISRVNRTLGSSTFLQASPFSGSVQSQDWGSSWWEYEIDFDVTQGREGKALSAFLTRLRGPANTFTLSDPSIANYYQRQTVTVNGPTQTGKTLSTVGWVYRGLGLEAGDFFSIENGGNHSLHQLVSDVSASLSGVGILEFEPELRFTPTDGQTLELVNPKITLRPLQTVPNSITTPIKYSFTMQAREDI